LKSDRSDETTSRAQSQERRFLDRTLAPLEQATTLALLLLTLLQPTESRIGAPVWVLVLVFQVYNLVVNLVRAYVPGFQSYTWKHILDVPVAGAVYALAGEPGGPLFVLFFLAVVCTASSETLRFSLLYTTIVALLVALSDVTLGARSAEDVRILGVRLLLIFLFGSSTAILTRRLTLEQRETRSVRGQALHLEELDRLRAVFISSVSHDLRTPLTAARAALGLLETSAAERLEAGERGLLNNTRRNIERLGMTIEDLLATNQLEAGTLSIERNLLDLRAVVVQAIGSVHPLMRDRRQTLEIAIQDPLLVEGDARRLEQAIVNVLSNAHEHTPDAARIEISSRATAEEIVLSVTDDGPGIPPQEREAIFERFHRLNEEGGSGLGLAIARSIVEMHGGRMWAESSGAGAAFHIALPAASEGGIR